MQFKFKQNKERNKKVKNIFSMLHDVLRYYLDRENDLVRLRNPVLDKMKI